MISNRMAELAVQCWRGEYEETRKLAEARGIRVKHDGCDRISFKSTSDDFPPNQASIPIVIYKGLDLGTIYVCLGWAFFGVYWPYIMDMKPLNKLWKEEIKNPKQTKEKVMVEQTVLETY